MARHQQPGTVKAAASRLAAWCASSGLTTDQISTGQHEPGRANRKASGPGGGGGGAEAELGVGGSHAAAGHNGEARVGGDADYGASLGLAHETDGLLRSFPGAARLAS